MKFKTTAKAIREQNTGDTIAIGYCDMQYLLRGVEPIAYTCGVYGWNFDVYRTNGLTICTGYRGMVGRSPRVSVREYEQKARAIWENWGTTYEQKKADTEKLLKEFCERA